MSRAKAVQHLAGVVDFKPYKLKKGEDFMSSDMEAHFRDILTRWKKELLEDASATKAHIAEDQENYADPVDRASQEEEFSLELRTRDRERKLVKKIDQALQRINLSEYGYCEDCGIEIALKRLEARPTAERCIDCKTVAELREKQGN